MTPPKRRTACRVSNAAAPSPASRIVANATPATPATLREAAIAVRDEDGWVARTTAECLENREHLGAELARRGVAQLPSHANFILCAAPSGSASDDAAALREQDVQVRTFAAVPDLGDGNVVLVSAHGNSLRALVKHLSGIPDDEIVGLEIPTGQPIVYELADDLSVRDRYYLSER